MATPGPSVQGYQFGVFTVDAESGELRRQGTRVRLQDRPFQLLVTLVERPGEVVTREELRQRFWSDGTFVDFDHSISSSVNKLRRALHDSSIHSRYIETVGRRGYRFVADVKGIPASGAAVETSQESAPPPDAPAHVERPASWQWMAPLVTAAIFVLVLTGYFQGQRSHSTSTAPAGKVMLAVLPFDNLTGDAAQDYFSDGMTEELITQLGQLDPQHVGVIARTSVMSYKHSPVQLQQIAGELGVQYVIEGSIRRDSDKIRITAQLIQAKNETRLWARQYDRELKDVLLLEGEIAREISDEIQISLGDHKPVPFARQPSLSPQAYEAYNSYLQGLYFWNKRTVEGFREAIYYFQRATDKDPNCARAYAGLADSYALIGGYSGLPRPEYARNARAAALRALEIDPNLSEAHTAFALVVEADLNWQVAEKEYQRAIELNPNYATAHHWYAEYLMWRGRFDEALRESERARQLDPLSLIIAADRGAILYYSRQYDRAIEQFRYVRDMDPAFPRAGLIVPAYVEKGMFAEAIALTKASPADALSYQWELAYVYGRSGQLAQAKRALDKLLEFNRRQPVDAGMISTAYISLGRREEALALLEKASAQRPSPLASLKVDPAYDSLRGDPRFQDLLRRVGLD